MNDPPLNPIPFCDIFKSYILDLSIITWAN